MNNSTPMFTSASKHCHCHCTCTCSVCTTACNSCSVLNTDPNFGQMSAENIRLSMFQVKNELKITQDLASKMMQNLRIISERRQVNAPKDSHKMQGPYPTPANQAPFAGDIIKNKNDVTSWVKYLVDQVQLKYSQIVKGQEVPSIGTLADAGSNITNTFWDWLNDKIHIMRVYSNYFNYAVCNHCNGACTTSRWSGACTCSCTGGTTASQNEVYTINPACNTGVDGAL